MIGEDAQSAAIRVCSPIAEMANRLIDVAGGLGLSGLWQMPLSLIGQPADVPPAEFVILMRRNSFFRGRG